MILSIQAAGLGAVLVGLGAACVVSPGRVREALRVFPRSRLPGWLLTAVVLAWSGYLLYHGPLGFLQPYRQWLFLLVPAAILLVALFVDELLAPRALGGLLLLWPAMLLEAARWHPSAWRYLVCALAYAMVIQGTALVVAPYLFRVSAERLVGTDARCRLWGAAGGCVGAVLLLVSWRVY